MLQSSSIVNYTKLRPFGEKRYPNELQSLKFHFNTMVASYNLHFVSYNMDKK
jgi:hypothetical protein